MAIVFDSSTSEDTKTAETTNTEPLLTPAVKRKSLSTFFDLSDSETTSKDDSISAYLEAPRYQDEQQDFIPDPNVDKLIADLKESKIASLQRQEATLQTSSSHDDKRKSTPINATPSLLRKTLSSSKFSHSAINKSDETEPTVEKAYSPRLSDRILSPRRLSSKSQDRGSTSSTPRSRDNSPRSETHSPRVDSKSPSPRTPQGSPKSKNMPVLAESPKSPSPRTLASLIKSYTSKK